MTASERQLLNVLYLAGAAERKQQLAGCLRFLVLATQKAGHAGYLATAEATRSRVQQLAPRHLLSRYESTVAALKSEDFAFFVKQLERSCPAERAEHLAIGLGFDAGQAVQQAGGDVQTVIDQLLADLRELPAAE